MTRSIFTRFVLIAALALAAFACKEEGRAEKAGRKFDEQVEEIREDVAEAVESDD